MLIARIAGVAMLLLGLLPIANWLPGGYAVDWYGERMQLWGFGLLLVVGVAMIMAIVERRVPALSGTGRWQRVADRWSAAGWRGDLAVALLALGCYIAVALLVYDRQATVIDEIVQRFQARIFASGRLTLPLPAIPELRSTLFLVESGGQLYGQYPAGAPAMIVPGVLIGAEWLVGPLFGATTVLLFARLLRRLEPAAGTALAALLLFALAPFVAFMSGSLMNHVTSLTFMMAAAVALAMSSADRNAHPRWAFGCGLALGIAATIRPLDAVAFALPTALWLLLRVRHGRRHLAALLASGVGVLLPLLALGYVNWRWTGSPFELGYEALWGPGAGLGFGAASPWNGGHTPQRGLEQINSYFLQLQAYLFELPVPGLLFATGTLLVSRRWSHFDRWFFGVALLLVGGYFAYWHNGFHLGPRFMYPLAPWLAWWTARFPAALREHQVPRRVERLLWWSALVALVVGVVQILPIRIRQYRLATATMPGRFADAAARAGIDHATILVRESWGAQMIARMWALGVSRPETEMYYRSTDACTLESALSAVEREGGGAEELAGALAPSRADSGKLVGLAGAGDETLRVLPGARYTARCLRRLDELKAGRIPWPAALLADDSNIWLRDLHRRDSTAIDPARRLWLLIREPQIGGRLRFLPVDVDSMHAEWRLD